ncbi:MAG TPA: EamA family transporter [Acetobacteraceae bacterium]|jgi:drug/metabolite transporter (DMT)-like permease|nr:EamA family transporter [Acetobacteraceae bacterium]
MGTRIWGRSDSPNRDRPGRATLKGSFALLLWSMLALLSRAATNLPPFQLTAMAFSVTAGFGLIWLWSKRQLGLLRQPPLAWLHGAGGLFGYHALFFAALKYAPAAEANLLNYAWPFLIVLLSAPILGLHLTWHHLLGVTIGLGGSVLLLARGTNFGVDAVFGYACAIAAAFTWAFYSVLAGRFRAVPTQAVIGFCAGGAVLAAIAHVLFEVNVTPTLPVMACVLLLGIGPVGGAFLLWDIGMKRGDPRLLGALAYGVPVASTVILGLAGFAPLSLVTVIAAILVTLGGWIAARKEGPRRATR